MKGSPPSFHPILPYKRGQTKENTHTPSADPQVNDAGAGGGGERRGEVHQDGRGGGVYLLLAHFGLPGQNGRAAVHGGLGKDW